MGSWTIAFSREGAPSPSMNSACPFLAFFRSFLLLERLAPRFSDSAMVVSGGVGRSGVSSKGSLSSASASSRGVLVASSSQPKRFDSLDFFLPFLFFDCAMFERWGSSASEISLLPADGVGSAAPVDASCSPCRVAVVLSRTSLSTSSASTVGSSPGIGVEFSFQLKALFFLDFLLSFLFLGIVIPFPRESTASDMSLLLSDGAEPVRSGFSKDSSPPMSGVVVSAFSPGVSAPES